jgi:plastocyanin
VIGLRPRIRIASLALAMVAAGIAATPGGAPSEAEESPPSAARTANVTVGDDFFRPPSLSVRRGTRVRWVWRGSDVHNVTVSSGPRRFNSRTQRRGTFTRTVRASGTYRIICTIHGQRMRIRVR